MKRLKQLIFDSRQLPNREDKKTKKENSETKSQSLFKFDHKLLTCVVVIATEICIMLNYFLRKMKTEANQNEFGILRR